MNKYTSTYDFSYETSAEIFTYKFCDNCKIWILANRPAKSELHKIYPSNYGAYQVKGKLLRFLRRSNFRSKIESFDGEKKQFLDYGAGQGEMTSVAAEYFEECLAFDFIYQKNTVGNIQYTNSEKDIQGINRINLITMLQVIEHLYDPLETLKFLKNKLAPDGKIIIETPIRCGWDSILIGTEKWGGWHAPRHFHIWSIEGFEILASKLGMQIIESKFIPSPYMWSETLKTFTKSKLLKQMLDSNNLFMAGILYILDLIQLKITRKTSNLHIVLGF